MSKRYLELDSFRGIAALAVFLFHFVMITEEHFDWFVWGTTGVDLFFIISGFVITMSLEHVSSSKEFVINRFSRLYPTYWTCVTFTFLIIVIFSFYGGPSPSFQQYIGNMTMFQFYWGILDLDGSYWTMIIEMLFYIFVLILYQLGLFRRITIIGTVLSVAITLITIIVGGETVKYILYNIPLLQFFPLFFAGIIFYKIIKKEENLVLLYTIIILCWLCETLLFPYVGRSNPLLSQTSYAIILGLYFGANLLFVNDYFKFITTKPLLFLGKISYAFYLTHYYISSRHIVPFLYHKMQLNFWVVLVITLTICILIACFITQFIEVPANKKLRRYLNKE